jgi:hypothetical protein
MRNLLASFVLLSLLVGTTFTESLVLGTEDISLFGEGLGTDLLSLGLVDVFHQDTLVLETVTLGLEVKVVIQVLIDLTSFSVLGKETTENTHTTHPDNLAGHTSIGSTLSLTVTHVATVTLSSGTFQNTETRLRDLGLTDNKTILDELTNVGTYITHIYSQLPYSSVNNQMYLRELALEISLTSLGSSQIFLWPHLRTEAARRF